MDLSHIIVNYHNSDLLTDCIESIYKTVNAVEFEIIVINNSLNDTGIDEVKKKFPGIKLVQNKTNVGFARANNQAFKISKGNVLLFLNPDVILTKEAVNNMFAYLNANQETGILGPKILDPGGTLQYSCRSFPYIWTGLFNRYSLMTKLFPNNHFTKKYLLTDFDHKEIREVDWLSGSCMMISKGIFKKSGLFDENYFIFNEDVDLCKTVKNHGFKVVYYPCAKIYHHITSSNNRVDPSIIIKRHLGMSYYFKKHHYKNCAVRSFINVFITLRCFSQLVFNLLKTSR